MTFEELDERIKLTFECPPSSINPSMKGFVEYDYDVDIIVLGVGAAVVLVGNEPLDKRCLDRGFRANLVDWEWSYTMHFEQSMHMIQQGRITRYNEIASWIDLPIMSWEQFNKLKNLIWQF